MFRMLLPKGVRHEEASEGCGRGLSGLCSVYRADAGYPLCYANDQTHMEFGQALREAEVPG